MRRARAQAGFTLVEVMIALAILAAGLVVLLRATASNVMAAQRAQMLTAATNLARGKMYDLEETLLSEGFQELDQTEEGNFSEEGWPQIEWKAEIVKIELPDMATLQGMNGAEGEAGATDAAGGAGAAGGLMGMLGGGMMGTGDATGQVGGAIMGTYFQMIADVLKDSMRKITLTVTYPVVTGGNETLEVSYYVTDPAAVNRKIPMAGVGGEEEEGGDAGAPTTPTTPGTGTGTRTGTGTTGTGTGTGTGSGRGGTTP